MNAPNAPAADMATGPLAQLRAELRAVSSSGDAAVRQRFFKTAPGEYGEGDRFLGIRVPALRGIARKYRLLPHLDALDLLQSGWHEERLVALFILVDAFSRGDAVARKEIFRAYLEHTRFINNWDLVDASAEHIVGAFIGPNNLDPLRLLASSNSLWERRIAIIATFHFTRKCEFQPTLEIAGLLLRDREDLIQKAVGWMLREVGKRDQPVEEAFLRANIHAMPRTMLRYAIERFPEPLRKGYLSGAVGGSAVVQEARQGPA